MLVFVSRPRCVSRCVDGMEVAYSIYNILLHALDAHHVASTHFCECPINMNPYSSKICYFLRREHF